MKVYELLDKPEKWTKGMLSRDSRGRPIDYPRDELAVCWCLLGAIELCYESREDMSVVKLVRNSINRGISEWNDAPERTYSEVISLCKELDI